MTNALHSITIKTEVVWFYVDLEKRSLRDAVAMLGF